MINRRAALAALATVPMFARLSAQSDSTAQILAAAQSGQPLPAGDFYFQPPLVLHDVHGLRGTQGRTILRPITTNHAANQVLIDIKTTQPGDPQTGLPRRSVFQDLRIISNGNGYGIMADGAMLRFKRVDVINCYHGVTIGWGVDLDFADCILKGNTANVFIAGRQNTSTTTVRFRGCQIRQASYAGIMILTGFGLTFSDTIIESNPVYGMVVNSGVHSVNLENVWFEANGTDVSDQSGHVTYSRMPPPR